VSNRRDEERVPIELRVEYKRINSFFADYTRNISRGGTFIRTDRPLDIGTEFVFRLQIPSLTDPLRLQGKVQWVVQPDAATDDQPAGMGIGFVYQDEAERQRVEGSVAKLMVDSLGPTLYEKLIGHRGRQS
jgi:type IV pilus assembly protein PilZ